MINFISMYVNYIDNVIRKKGPEIYDLEPQATGSWHRVLECMKKYVPVESGRNLILEDNEVVNTGCLIDYTEGVDAYIQEHLYEITKVDRYILTYWKRVKEGLMKYAFRLTRIQSPSKQGTV